MYILSFIFTIYKINIQINIKISGSDQGATKLPATREWLSLPDILQQDKKSFVIGRRNPPKLWSQKCDKWPLSPRHAAAHTVLPATRPPAEPSGLSPEMEFLNGIFIPRFPGLN
jgi:hypothetical protein